jgi:hypothetical protein
MLVWCGEVAHVGVVHVGMVRVGVVHVGEVHTCCEVVTCCEFENRDENIFSNVQIHSDGLNILRHCLKMFRLHQKRRVFQ